MYIERERERERERVLCIRVMDGGSGFGES